MSRTPHPADGRRRTAWPTHNDDIGTLHRILTAFSGNLTGFHHDTDRLSGSFFGLIDMRGRFQVNAKPSPQLTDTGAVKTRDSNSHREDEGRPGISSRCLSCSLHPRDITPAHAQFLFHMS
ncbi:hypothetical protein DPEC_G00101730 [Dallia pectoralis]|uniref:Uncharacterized protein n=1 Tax=Dallia pectoralis TaxID=75939 RepID=A0ACC2GX86_DALPE|nr:hypothetical protein DPEC_G00101730 [Dallia pectoralis]